MLTLLSAVHDNAVKEPDSTAFLVKEGSSWKNLTWSILEDQAQDWAVTFLAHPLAPGSVVFIVLKHCSDLYPAFLGVMRAGLIPSFLPFPTPKQDTKIYWDNHKTLFERVRPSCILSYSANIAPLQAALGDLNCPVLDVADARSMRDLSFVKIPPLAAIEAPGAAALLQYSSGTTGLKKGVVLTYEKIRLQLLSYAKAINASKQDCTVSWLPVYHDMGLITSFLMPIMMRSKVVSIDAFDWLSRPDILLRLIEEHKATLCWLPNFAFNHLVRNRSRKQTYDLSTMRAFVNCSEPCKAETFERFRTAFQADGLPESALQTCYAMAEIVFSATQTEMLTVPVTVFLDPQALREHGRIIEVPYAHPGAKPFLSCGKTVDGLNLRVLAEAGKDVGEVQLSGDFVFSEYYCNAGDTEAAFVEGWYRTGDIGFILRGELYICGRIKELLIVHGRNYYANDIEMIVNFVEGIKPGRAVAFGVYDPLTGSEEVTLLAEIEPDFGGDHMELGRSVKSVVFDNLELSLKTVEILPAGALIKTSSGKISRKENRHRYLEDR